MNRVRPQGQWPDKRTRATCIIRRVCGRSNSRVSGVTVAPYFRTTWLPTRSLLASFIVGRKWFSSRFNAPLHSALINGTTAGLS